jgi:hypothetical protein
MPTLGVNIAILDDNNHLLLARRDEFDVWCLPGGEVEAGESLTQAALREANVCLAGCFGPVPVGVLSGALSTCIAG